MTANARRNLLMVLLVAECVCAAYVVASRLPGLIDQRWVQDDAYISFRFAKNFVRGDGLVYNVGAYVEGYTNFLWTMISAIPLAAGIEDPLDFMHVVGGILWVLSYLLLLRLSVLFFRESLWIAPLALLPLAFHWSFNMWFLSGMETPLVSFFTIATVYFFSRDPVRHPRTLFWASLFGVLLTMTRPDGVVALAGIAAAGAVCDWRRVVVERRWRTYIVAPLLPILLLYVPFNLWRIWYYGDFYPNTYYAKVGYLPYYERGWIYLRSFFQIYGLIPWLPFVPLGALCARAGSARRFLWAATFVSGGVMFYVVRLGGDFMEWRFLTPAVGVLYPAIVVGAAAVFLRLGGWLRRHAAAQDERVPGALGAWIGGLIVTGLLIVVTRGAPADAIEWYQGGHEAIALLRRYGDPRYDWRAAGKVFNQVLPPNAKVALTAAGMIPFFCDRPVLDLHGLTDPVIAREPIEPDKRGRVGHEHWLTDHSVMRQRGVDLVLDWADPHPYATSILKPPTAESEIVSVQLPDRRYVDFTILNPATFDRATMAKDPRVVFYGAVKVADRNQFHTLGDRYRDWRVIDSIDLEETNSEKAHTYIEKTDGPHRGSWHMKFTHYVDPFREVQLEDNGRRLPISATWQVQGVTAGQPLVFVARYDHTRGAKYDLEVNGRRLPQALDFPGGQEFWDELVVEIPPEYLVAGTNQFELINRTGAAVGDTELYYFWFLQP